MKGGSNGLTELASSGRYAKANANENTNTNTFANASANTNRNAGFEMCYPGSQTCSRVAAREMSHVGQGYTIGDSNPS